MLSFKQFLSESDITAKSDSLVGKDGTRYHHEKSHIDIKHSNTVHSPRKHSIVSFEVDNDKRGKGIGKKLLTHALSKHNDLGGQASSTASVKVMHNAGLRNPSIPNGSFADHEKMREDDSSVYMAHKDENGKAYV
jgi:predicted GNAT family acetyltransferase